MDIEYSDGAQIEQRILELLKAAPDLSSRTSIASEHYTEWPVRYHLCSTRANLLRPFDFSNLKVLELGAGMGAISRFLAENARELMVVEGTRARYTALCERLRDLTNWRGQIGNIEGLDLKETFDVVVVVGALEYSELFLKSTGPKSPFTAFLDIAKRHLTPTGVLILAIENRLGLKYWGGAAEDHTGRLFDGICGYSVDRTPKTFARNELKQLLSTSGFSQVEEYFPFPDYKMPTSILSLDLLERFPSLASDLSSQREYETYGQPRITYFPEALAARSLASASLLPEFANSFLWFCSLKQDSPIFTQLGRLRREEHQLAWHYANQRRFPAVTVFQEKSPGELIVSKVRSDASSTDSAYLSAEGCQIIWNRPAPSRVLSEPKALEHLLRLTHFKGPSEGLEFLYEFLSWSFNRWSLDFASVRGGALDAIISNAVIEPEKRFDLFDLEWSLDGAMPKSWFVLRNTLTLGRHGYLFANDPRFSTLKEIYTWLCQRLHVDSALQEDLAREARLQNLVTGEATEAMFLSSLQTLVQHPANPLHTDPAWLRREQERLRTLMDNMAREQAAFTRERNRIEKLMNFLPFRIIRRIDDKLCQYPPLRRAIKGTFLFPFRVVQRIFRRQVLQRIENVPKKANVQQFQLAHLKPLNRGWVRVHASRLPRGPIQVEMQSADLNFPLSLPRTQARSIKATVKLTTPINNILVSIDANASAPPVFKVHRISKLNAAIRLVTPQFFSMLRDPAALRDFLMKGLHLYRDGKLRGLVAWIHQQALLGNVTVLDDYGAWVTRYDTLSETDRNKLKAQFQAMSEPPLISVVMPVYNTNPKYLSRAIDSVLKQIYPHWELCISDDHSSDPNVRKILEYYRQKDPRIRIHYRTENGHIARNSNDALSLAAGSYVALLDHDDELAEHALAKVAEAIVQDPALDLIYSDEDKMDASGRRFNPHFKPDWNPELFYSYNLITHLAVFRRKLVQQIGGFREGFEGSQDYDLILRMIEATTADRIYHIPQILYHWRVIPGSTAGHHGAKDYAFKNARRAIAEHLERLGRKAEVVAGAPGNHRVIYSLPKDPPKVTGIVCTKDRVKLLKTMVSGFLDNTSYANRELIIVDNGSIEPQTKTYLEKIAGDPRVKVHSAPGPFNFSALNNAAAHIADGELLVFLNNDLEIIQKDWLTEMVRFAIQPHVGAVGAKLLYPDTTIQHAGIILGIGIVAGYNHGVAGHAHKGFGRYDQGFMARLLVNQCTAAVTGACLMIRRNLFLELGGFDETNLPVAFNDVDMCLTALRKGYVNVFTPYAELFHHESASRGSDETPENHPRFVKECNFMMKRWGSLLGQDPYYNPNLTLERENFSLAFPPRASHPPQRRKSKDRVLQNSNPRELDLPT